MQALLDAPSMTGLPDTARLAAIVILAKTNADSGQTGRIRAVDLGRWLGVSESSIDHTALPALRDRNLVTTNVTTDSTGQTTGLTCRLTPVTLARQQADREGALFLDRRELATLWRLIEALFGPGWSHKEGPPTPAGLCAERTGRGAATDRLCLLLLVLHARSDGTVRMVAGSVGGQGRGRGDSTAARALGCTASGASKVLARLRVAGLVVSVRVPSGSGLKCKTELQVPAVADAHRR
ncbi:hypothetical protein [Streptomyces sp. NPDC046925]|uniref:hypothetical protein n=1 Tax=Streptomyces sp. NPDC046925 TaxID=3155375 RepID=UPI0033C5FF54